MTGSDCHICCFLRRRWAPAKVAWPTQGGRAGALSQPPHALGSRPASSAGSSCWAARQQELDLRHVQRVVTAPLWLPSFGARDGNDPRHPLHRVGVLGSGGRHSPATSVGCPSLATVGVPSSRTEGAAHSEDFITIVCFSIGTLSDMPRVCLLSCSRWLWPAGRRRPAPSRSDGMPGFQPFETLSSQLLVALAYVSRGPPPRTTTGYRACYDICELRTRS